MQRNNRFIQFSLVIAFIIAMAGMAVSLILILITASPQLAIMLDDLQHPAAGSAFSKSRFKPFFSPQPSSTPFQPMATWTITASPLPSSTPTLTPTVTETPLPPPPTETPLPTDTPIPDEPPPAESSPGGNPFPPDEASINNIEGHAQSYSLDCEARSALDLASYFGIYIDENEFLSRLPSSDDPNEGFVGNYWDPRGQIPPASYGVHAGPIAALLRDYGLNAYDARGLSWETLRAEIAFGRPVMAWVINNTLSGYPISYTPSNGNTTTVASFEHTVLVIGYTQDYAVILDGNIVYWRTIWQFLDSWSVLGNMAVMVQ